MITKHGTGPNNYLECYEDLLYITSGVAEQKLNHFFMLEPVPLLREFEQQIKAFDALRKEICMFRCKVSNTINFAGRKTMVFTSKKLSNLKIFLFNMILFEINKLVIKKSL